MATATMYNHFCKGVTNNNSGTRMTWWKTSFNMPVPNLYDVNLSPSWTEGSGIFTYQGEAISFDLSGFEPGWEALAAFTNFNLHGPFAGGNITYKQSWRNTNNDLMFELEDTYYYPSLSGTANWYERQLWSNQGVASWEISGPGVYKLETSMVGSGINITTTWNLYISNVPNTSTTYTPGMVWVEGSQLCYVSANGHIHRISGTSAGSVGSTYAGKIWCAAGTNDIYWIGNDGIKYYSNSLASDYTRRTLKQVYSYASNGSPGEIYTGTGETGKIWVDTEYGYEHIGFINKDGYKSVLYSGNYPYTDPN